jgi:hypothetical protein
MSKTFTSLLLVCVVAVLVLPACNDDPDQNETSQEGKGLLGGALSKVRDMAKPQFVAAFSKGIDKLKEEAQEQMDQWDDEASQADQETRSAYRDAKEAFQKQISQAEQKLEEVRQSDNFQNAKASAIVAWEQAEEAFESLMAAGTELE